MIFKAREQATHIPQNRFDDQFDGGPAAYRLSRALLCEDVLPLERSDNLKLGFIPARLPSNPALAELVQQAGALKESVGQARSIEHAAKFLATLDGVMSRFREQLLPLLKDTDKEALKAAFELLDDFIATRPVRNVRLWSGELALTLHQKVIAYAAKAEPDFLPALDWEGRPLESAADLEMLVERHAQARRFIYDRLEAGKRKFLEDAATILAEGGPGWGRELKAALKTLQHCLELPGRRTMVHDMLEPTHQIVQQLELEITGRHMIGKKEAGYLVRLFELQSTWERWGSPAAYHFSNSDLQQLKASFAQSKHDPRLDAAADWGFYGSSSALAMTLPAPLPFLTQWQLKREIHQLEKRAARLMPGGEPVAFELYHTAFGTPPPESIVRKVVELQEANQVKTDTADKPQSGLRALMDEAFIRERVQKSKAAIYGLRKGASIEAAYLLCSDAASLPALGIELREILGIAKDTPFILADLMVQRPGASFMQRDYGLNPYAELHKAVLALAHTEVSRGEEITMAGIVRVRPNPNLAIRAHERLGWKQTGQIFEAPNGQSYAVLKFTLPAQRFNTWL